MLELGSNLAKDFSAGDLVLLVGELGAGKTTFVRGVLLGLGFTGHVKSPTYNLIQTYATDPPVMHSDLYRVKSSRGLGLEEYLETHLCFVEWPDRLDRVDQGIEIGIEFTQVGRRVTIRNNSERRRL